MTLPELDLDEFILRLSSNAAAQEQAYHFRPNPAGFTEISADLFSELPRPAAVLIPLLRPPDPAARYNWHVLFIHRTDTVADHKGQVAFPGGRADLNDLSSTETALREANEEIGILPQDVNILGQLEPLYTVSNYLVTPVVGIIPWKYTFRLQTTEVSRVFTIPLAWLAESENYTTAFRSMKFPLLEQERRIKVIRYRAYENEILWGVSAEITLQLLTRLGLVKS